MNQSTARVNDSESYLNFGPYFIRNGRGKFVPVYDESMWGSPGTA